MRTFGSILKIIAKSALMIAKETRKSHACHTAAGSGSRALMYLPSAASTALSTSETRSRKPIASTIENERKRSRTSVKNARPGLTATPQIVLSAFLSSANTVDRAKEQHGQPDDRREHAGRFFRRARLHRGLNRLARAGARQRRNFLRDLPAGRFFTKDEARDRDDNYEQGRERKNGIVCERGAEPHRTVFDPFGSGFLQQLRQIPWTHIKQGALSILDVAKASMILGFNDKQTHFRCNDLGA